MASIRSQLKNVFWPNIFVGASFQILAILQYACGLKLGPAAILNQNPIFEMASGNGFKTPSKVQWLRCRPPINAHILSVCCAFSIGLRLALEPDLGF